MIVLIGAFTLMGNLTAKEQTSILSNDPGNPQIEIQLDIIEHVPNQDFTGMFRLQLYVGGQAIYDKMIDFSAGSRIINEQIPDGRIGNLGDSDTELVITIEAVDSGMNDSFYVARLDVEQTFDVTLHLQESSRSSGIAIQGSIRIE